MSTSFNPAHGLILVPVQLWGPTGDTVVHFALDTGATCTMVNADILVTIGYDPALAPGRVRITTESGVEFVPRMRVDKLKALGQERAGFPILCHTLPTSALVDGLLGLDFYRGQKLTVDFHTGQITLI